MFTGLIEKVCSVRSIQHMAGSMKIAIDMDEIASECNIGDSIAVQGVCLTISKIEGNLASFDVSAETIARTSLDKLNSSSQVNIERAMKANDRFGGHFVLGHIDGTAKIQAIEKHGEFVNIKFSASPELLEMMVLKGSVSVDGISLTLANIDKEGFSVAVIPQTFKKTTLNNAKIGDCVNIETDIIIKAVKKQLDKILPKNEPLTAEKLRELGF
jgi:riboflavin synthase